MTNSRQLFIDLKAQDRLREWFSKRGGSRESNLVVDRFSLGDSDVDYELSQQLNSMQILPTPYQTPQIRHKLIFDGDYSNVTGSLKLLVRKLNEVGGVSATYDSSGNLTQSRVVPDVKYARDPSLLFTTAKEGYIVFIETLPDNYVDTTGAPLRLKESYDVIFTNLPQPIDFQSDGISPKSTFTTPMAHDLTPLPTSALDLVYLESLDITNLNANFQVEVKTVSSFYVKLDSGYLAANVGNGKLHKWSTSTDSLNGSFIIAKGRCKLQGSNNGLITIKGKLSGIEKRINFNY